MALKHPRRNQLVVLGGRNDAGACPPLAGHRLINPLTPGRAAILTMQAMIHAAFVQVKDGPAVERFEFAAEEPALDLVALAIGYEFLM